MLNKKLKKHLKVRIVSSLLDMLLFFFLFIISFVVLLNATNIENTSIFVYFSFFFFLYYAVFPKVTKGYTLSGLLFGIKIIKLNGNAIALWEYLIRALYGIFSYIRFLGYMRVRTNLAGQFYFDKPFKITVIGKEKITLSNIDIMKEFSFYFLGE